MEGYLAVGTTFSMSLAATSTFSAPLTGNGRNQRISISAGAATDVNVWVMFGFDAANNSVSFAPSASDGIHLPFEAATKPLYEFNLRRPTYIYGYADAACVLHVAELV